MDRCPLDYQREKTLSERILSTICTHWGPSCYLCGVWVKENGRFLMQKQKRWSASLLPVKELELRELRMTLERAGAEQAALQRQLVGFQVRCWVRRHPHHCPSNWAQEVRDEDHVVDLK